MIYMDTESPIMIEKTVEDLVSRKAECILCMDDAICRHVLDKLSKDGIRVPEDIKVASFYNSSLLENNAVSITSLQFDVRKLGIYSCHALLDILDGKTVQQRTELEYTVSMKESTKI
jgi:DNA-binding LacI/PurR family transcriptional regulator